MHTLFKSAILTRLLAGGAMLAGLAVTPVLADNYPVSGTFTYDNATAAGGAKVCGAKRMEFSSDTRRDTEGGVHQFRNRHTTLSGEQQWKIVEDFADPRVRNGNVDLTLTRLDADHIQVFLSVGNHTIKLRRCA